MRYRATVAYDGLGYHGFQRQSNASPTIQAEIEAALERVSGQAVQIVGAGRTDAGVHAIGQVIAFDLDWPHSADDLRNALNANLPRSIAIWSLGEARADFHPRYDALSRTYVYRLYVAEVRDPLRRRRAWHVMASTLDQGAMQAAADELLGEHDFSPFGSAPKDENTMRRVYEARWEVAGPPSTGGLSPWSDDPLRFTEYRFTITATSFLYRMVRRTVSTLVEVGLGRMTPETFRGILAARDRNLVAGAAPPQGLTLVAVRYGDDLSG